MPKEFELELIVIVTPGCWVPLSRLYSSKRNRSKKEGEKCDDNWCLDQVSVIFRTESNCREEEDDEKFDVIVKSLPQEMCPTEEMLIPEITSTPHMTLIRQCARHPSSSLILALLRVGNKKRELISGPPCRLKRCRWLCMSPG
jgi:hypothetical protein